MNKSIKVNVGQQLLSAHEDNEKAFEFAISTAAKGIGQHNGSEQTPLGKHLIRAKIGGGAALGTVFKGRRPTGELYSPELGAANPKRDWILTRILWLSGCEKGHNRLGDVDTMRRYIYMHGCPDSKFGHKPFTHGCIGMRNADIIRLFDWVPVNIQVSIA